MGHTLYQAVTEDYQLGPSLPFAYSMNQAQTQASGLRYPWDATGYVQELTTLQAGGVISSNIPVQEAMALHYLDQYSLQWMVGIEQTLPWAMALEVDYNGNRGLHENFKRVIQRHKR